MNRSRGWQWTWNNYNEDDIEYINNIDCTYLIYGKEIGEEKLTPHLQGFIYFSEAKSFKTMKQILKFRHIEPAKSYEALIKYSKKDGDIFEKGIPPKQGQKKNEQIEEEIILTKPDRPWQLEVLNLIEQKPTRQIHWYWESEGGVGKSTLAKWICYHYPAICVSGKATDCKYAIVKFKETKKIYPKIIILDIPRSNIDDISYGGIEEIENGLFFSGKYESAQVIMNHPHVIIFANRPPNKYTMSERKWDIQELKMQKVVCVDTSCNNTQSESHNQQ